jgi:alpha-galactosidase
MTNESLKRIKLKGLRPELNYQWAGQTGVYGGDELMYTGLNDPVLHGDFQSLLIRLKQV